MVPMFCDKKENVIKEITVGNLICGDFMLKAK